MSVLINPGTGPLESGTKAQARLNLIALLVEAGVGPVAVGRMVSDGRGRWDVTCRTKGRSVDVSIPGCPLGNLRDGKDMWRPRLYVDGNSWYWRFAVELVSDALLGDAAPEEKP